MFASYSRGTMGIRIFDKGENDDAWNDSLGGGRDGGDGGGLRRLRRMSPPLPGVEGDQDDSDGVDGAMGLYMRGCVAARRV